MIRPSMIHSISFTITRLNFSVLAQNLEHTNRSRTEPITIQNEYPKPNQRTDPFALVASELTNIRKNMLNLLGSAHPGLSDMAEYYFLHSSNQLRSLLVLLFSRATNGLGPQWQQKYWDSVYEINQEELDRPLTLPNVLNEPNPSMPDHTGSFSSVFCLHQATQRSPPLCSIQSSLIVDPSPTIISQPLLLPAQIRLAQIVEMIHVAFLLHETIEQGPDEQNQGLGGKLSILGGDFLLGRASTALSRLGENEVVELVASVISNLVEGEILSMDEVRTSELGLIEGPTSLSLAWELYLRKIYLKTASLMAKSARSAVILGGCQGGDMWKDIAYVYARNLGIAYQLVEDAMDLNSLQPGLASGPALFACEESPNLLPLIQRSFTQKGDTNLGIKCIEKTSGLEKTRRLAQAYVGQARDALRPLPDSDAKEALEALTEIVIERTW